MGDAVSANRLRGNEAGAFYREEACLLLSGCESEWHGGEAY